MPTPVINLDRLSLKEHGHGERFAARIASIAPLIGAEQLGYRLVELAPGKEAWPYHKHHANEELFIILTGQGELRFDEELHPLHPGDLVACPVGHAHAMRNTGNEPMRYLAISTMRHPEVVEYPDSGKFGCAAGRAPGSPDEPTFVHFGRVSDAVDYWEGEE